MIFRKVTDELSEERWALALDRLSEVKTEKIVGEALAECFTEYAEFVLLIGRTVEFLDSDGVFAAPLEEVREHNRSLYEQLLPAGYERSFVNPVYAVSRLGEEHGRLLTALGAELRSMIGFAYDGLMEELVIRAELLLEVYGMYLFEAQEEGGGLPPASYIRESLESFACDYAEVAAANRIRDLVADTDSLAVRILREADLLDERYLYAYGEYIGDNERELASFMNSLPESEIATMADTYTEGYRIGFEVAGKDLTIKKVAELRYPVGMERMMKKAVSNLAAINLLPVIHRPAASLLYHPTLMRNGFVGGAANRQYEFDHRDDRGIILSPEFVSRHLEALGSAFAQYRGEARGYAGPAVVESFGERDFEPQMSPECVSLSEAQSRLWVEYRSKAGEIQREYIIEEERSFTIIAFPAPEITEALPDKTPEGYAEFFREIIKVNTLDYVLYRDVQQKLIDALDLADYVEITGCGDNRTRLCVNLWKLGNASKETIFENCVADVNIPVGEVFTSPVLEGTNGVLHVTRVFLNGLEYRDLSITFKDGYITDYSCGNYSGEDGAQKGREFIAENILFRHKTLPIGEFAIGTNTTAYMVARRYGVESKMPILIAEKTGPHFAVGDTCYSHAESIPVFNPDGKEIVARTNSAAEKRHDNPGEAYFNCHTDITIPYEELGELTAVCKDGTRIPIIVNGRFVLPGSEPLNVALDCEKKN